MVGPSQTLLLRFFCFNTSTPKGQLPFLTHGSITLSGLLSIVRYVSKLSGAFVLDDHLSEAQRAQSTARVAHVQSELGDLVVSFYPIPPLGSIVSHVLFVSRPMSISRYMRTGTKRLEQRSPLHSHYPNASIYRHDSVNHTSPA